MEWREETGEQEENERGKAVRLPSSHGDKRMNVWLTECKYLLWEVFADSESKQLGQNQRGLTAQVCEEVLKQDESTVLTIVL